MKWRSVTVVVVADLRDWVRWPEDHIALFTHCEITPY